MRPLAFIILAFLQINLVFGQTSLKAINLENGDFKVGFNHYLASDSTRTYKRIFDWNNQSIPRPIPISIWYPATHTAGDVEHLSILDYMHILKEEEEWEHLPNDQILNWFEFPNNLANQNHLKEQVNAAYRIHAAEGKFPVVVYAPSYQASSIENFALCEYLASHGYVVIASPSRGAENRFFEGGTPKDLETQARDIELLIKEVQKLPYVSANHMATMGFSFGGLSNVLSQMRNENIKAIVSLDGSIKYQFDTLKKSPFFNMEKVDVPFIHMAQKNIPEQVLIEDKLPSELNSKFEFYDSLTNSKAYRLKFHNLTHSHFSTLGVLLKPRDKRQDKTDAEIMESYKLVSQYALNFLDAYLKNDSVALNFLNTAHSKNGMAEGLLKYQTKEPQVMEFGFNDFNEMAAKQNYQELYALYELSLKKHPSLELAEGKLNNLGLQLVFDPKTSGYGINIFLLATSLYPNSWNLYDSLAEAYLFLGDTSYAISNFKKSLDLNPQNQNAIDRLEQLKP